MKAKVFIGSSVEGLKIAEKIQENLDYNFDCKIWTQDTFELSQTTIESLEKVLANSDFAIFVFSHDDITTIRSKETVTIRDNVIFETGLFIGRLGRKRVFMVTPRGSSDLHLPTDLLGIMIGNYDSTRSDLAAALGPFCSKIKDQINEIWISGDDSNIYSKDNLLSLLMEFNSEAFRTPFDDEESLTGFQRRIKEVLHKVKRNIDQISPNYRSEVINIYKLLESISRILNKGNHSVRYYPGRENSIVIDAIRLRIMEKINDILADLKEAEIRYKEVVNDSLIVKNDYSYNKFKQNLPSAIELLKSLNLEEEIVNNYEFQINKRIEKK